MKKCPFEFEYNLNATKIQQGKQHNSVVESHTLTNTRMQNYVYITSHERQHLITGVEGIPQLRF
jgi:hypothetical protein